MISMTPSSQPESDQSLRVAIVLAAIYPPPGIAAAKRIQAFAAGLRENGVDAIVVALAPKAQPVGTASRGVDNADVPYILATETRSPERSRIASFLRRPALLQRVLAAELEANPVDAVIVYGHWWFANRKVYQWCRAHNVPIVADCTEWWNAGWMNRYAYLDTLLFRKLLFSRSTGIIAISRIWEEFARRRGLPAIRIPSVLLPLPGKGDPSSGTPVKAAGPFVLTYIGVLHDRDLPFTMLAGVLEAVRRGVDVKLVIIGQRDVFRSSLECRTQVDATQELVDRVEFAGRVGEKELEHRLHESDAFVLLRNDDWESRACFPTRLPEFLLSKRPVITSAAGDVVLHLQHMRDAWLLPPGEDPGALAEAIHRLASDPALARRIGTAGNRLAREFFDATSHMRHLRRFLEQLVGMQVPVSSAPRSDASSQEIP